jgi:hypothetical protein
VTGLELLARVLPQSVVNALRAYFGRPRPDPRIVEVEATGGATGKVDFAALVQNYGTQPARISVTANVEGEEVQCNPAVVDLLVNSPPTRITIIVPRPQLGDLVPQFNNETTLYGRELEVIAQTQTGKHEARWTWREIVYDAETERERHAIQQRVWRLGRGEGTEADERSEWLSRKLRGLDEP